METKTDDTVSYFIEKDEIIKKFGIKVPKGYDTWSYYRNNVLEIKVVKLSTPSTKK